MPKFYKEEELNDVWQEVYNLQCLYSKLLRQLDDCERLMYNEDVLMDMWQTAHDIRLTSRKLAFRIKYKIRPLKRLRQGVRVNTNNCPGCGQFYGDNGCVNLDCTGPGKPPVSNPNPRLVRNFMRECDSVLIGIKTRNGEVVRKTGYHGAENMLQRGFSPINVKNVLEKANIHFPGNFKNSNSTNHVHDSVWVNLGNDGKIRHVTRRT